MDKNLQKAAKEKMDQVKLKTMQAAEKEIARVKQQMEKTSKQVEEYARKNPEKAALISAGIGAAMGAALALLIKGGAKKKK